MTRVFSPGILEQAGAPQTQRLIPYGALLVTPSVGLDGDWLTSRWPRGPFESWRMPAVPDDLLDRFLRLAHASPKRILAFARRWGALGLCGHGLPMSHHNLASSGTVVRGCEGLIPRSSAPKSLNPTDENGLGFREPLSSWRMLSTDAGTALTIACHVRDGEPRTSLWRRLSHHSDGYRFYARMGLTPSEDAIYRKALTATRGTDLIWWPRTPEDDRAHLADFLNEWLVIGDVRPQLDPANFTVRFADPGVYPLFGAIALQLVAAVAGGKWYLCSSCDGWSKPAERKPQAGKRYFCLKCGHPAAVLQANRDRLARRRNVRAGTAGERQAPG